MNEQGGYSNSILVNGVAQNSSRTELDESEEKWGEHGTNSKQNILESYYEYHESEVVESQSTSQQAIKPWDKLLIILHQ